MSTCTLPSTSIEPAMSIQFEEVTGEIEAPRQDAEAPPSPPPQPADDSGACLERALRLQAERAARINDD